MTFMDDKHAEYVERMKAAAPDSDFSVLIQFQPVTYTDARSGARIRMARQGVTVLFSTHVIAHAERLCERIAIVAGGRIRFEGSVSEARDQLRPQVRLRTRATDGNWRRALPAGTVADDGAWHFDLPDDGIEPLLRALLDGQAGIESLSIERPGLHDAFVWIAGTAAARQMEEEGAEKAVA
jgi:ABC-2 type transport system ATP-binding protein